MKKRFLWLDKLAELILKRWPEVLFGKPSVIQDHYRGIYGQKDWTEFVHRSRLRTAQRYLIVIIVAVFVATSELGMIARGPTYIETLRRPSGVGSFQEELIAIASYKGKAVHKNITVIVPPVALTEQEKQQKLTDYMRELPRLILNENIGLNRITGDLILPHGAENTAISVEWISDNPELVDEKGHLDSLSALIGGTVNLTAILTLAPLEKEMTIPVFVPPGKDQDHTQAMEKRLASLIESVELDIKTSNSKEAFFHLPDTAGDGISIQWKEENNSGDFSYLFLFLIGALLLVYNRRYVEIKREALATRKSILSDFPDLVLKLVLLLNAGMVTESSLRKIALDYLRTRDPKSKRPLFEGLVELNKRISETNSSLVVELREFAFLSGVRELSRFARIVEDNMNKGSTLIEKLEGETAILWISRKKRAEEKARLAETKLTFPLLLLLIALVIITTAPVLITM
jgi:hypothetical protein